MKTHLLLIAALFSFVFANAQVPYNWFLDEYNPGMDISVSPDDSNPQEGMYACKMDLLQPEVPYLVSDNFSVTAGDSYTFTIYYYDNDSRASLKFYADFYDASGEDIYGEDPIYSEDGEGWQMVTWSATVPTGAVESYILIKLYDDDGYVDEATVWVDNVSFVVNSENLVVNGSYEFWPGVGVYTQSNDQESIFIYPNPVHDIMNISLLETNADKIVIRNSLGQIVKTTVLNNNSQAKLDISNLQDGVYFVSMFNGEKSTNTQKILKK